MPRDYKYRAAPQKPQKTAPAWLWALAGLLVGALAVSLVWLKLDEQPPAERWVGAEPDRPPQQVEEETPVAQLPPHKPRFNFYDKLPGQEVLVPEEQLELRAEPALADPSSRYLIQVISYANTADAERMKAELALLGIETRVGEAVISGGRTVYRVMAGPYLGRDELDRARKLLKSNGHANLLVRILR